MSEPEFVIQANDGGYISKIELRHNGQSFNWSPNRKKAVLFAEQQLAEVMLDLINYILYPKEHKLVEMSPESKP